VQVDLRLNLISALDMTLSVGYAQAVQPGEDQHEFMASLKVLRKGSCRRPASARLVPVMLELTIRALVGLLPVLLFLGSLLYLDSYKLVRLRSILWIIALGGLIAGLGYIININLLPVTGLEFKTYSRYVAPFIEEIAKGLILVYLIHRARVGFPVDAAIFGFAVGTGFAVIENIYYLGLLADSHLVVWLVRGFGTAVMHGGTTAMFGIVAKTLVEKKAHWGPMAYLPGLALVVAVHSVFNHFFLTPVLSTALILLGLPPLLFLVFARSEEALRSWLDVGFDADAELLELIHSGDFSDSKVGRYLHSLKERFHGPVVADLLCYLRLHTELSLRAKGVLMMREAGFREPLDEDVRAGLEELDYLGRSIGRTGKLAMAPFLGAGGKEIWQLSMLRD
jgi:RsiW-degrading membrane proteinase PrsW (M82 family)